MCKYLLSTFLQTLTLTICICFPIGAYAQQQIQDQERENLLSMFSGEWLSRGIYVATKLEIADHLHSPKSIQDLAKLSACDSNSLYRLLHMLAGYGIFQEVSHETFANTKTSLLLSKTHPNSLHALAIFYGEDIHQALDELLLSIQTKTPAFDLKFQQPVFGYFKENPTRAALFQEAMREKSKAVIQSTLSSYDFSPFQTVYDIGGGYGQFMKALLEKYPSLSGNLFELPEVIARVQQANTNIQCALSSGDFFESIPEGGDLYILKSVLHDWNDAQAQQILKNCHKSMGPNSRLLIVEVVLQPGSQSLYANCMDVLMLAITGGKERSLASFKQMLESCDLVLENIYPTSTEFSILEVKKVASQRSTQDN